MKVENKRKSQEDINPMASIPLDQREHWLSPAIVFSGLEFCVPVMIVGSVLIGSFSLKMVMVITILAMLLATLPINAISGYIGAKTGLSSSVLARRSFGDTQARFLIGIMIAVVTLGHWGMQTAVAGNAMCAMFGVDYLTNKVGWVVVTTIVGFLFAVPSIFGYSSMKWTNYVAVPSGLMLVVFGVFLAFKSIGTEVIMNYNPIAPTMTILMGINLVISLNSAQSLLAMDYTRHAKPTWSDNLKIPFGIIIVGFPLVTIGALMAVGHGSADIVQVMIGLGFPVWGYLVLWLSTWTSQLVNNYSAGLSLSNALNVTTEKGRRIVTLLATVFAIILALAGILDRLVDLYSITGMVFPAIAGVIFTGFYMAQKGMKFKETNWNWKATIAMIAGGIVGWITTYNFPIGIPAIHSIITSCILYYVIMKPEAEVE